MQYPLVDIIFMILNTLGYYF